MKEIIRNTCHVLACALICCVWVSCNNDDPTPETKILDKVSIEWNSSQAEIREYMRDFSLIDSDEEFLQYTDDDGIIMVSYDFVNDSLRASAAIVPKTSDISVTPYLDDYTEFAELSAKKVYYNTYNNTMCFLYEVEEQDEEYTVLGFTPINSDLYESVNQ